MQRFTELRRLREQPVVEAEESSSEDDAPTFSYASLLETYGEEQVRDITGFTNQEFQEIVSLIAPMMIVRGRGRRGMDVEDSLALFLAWATSGMTYKEIARHFMIPIASVKTTISKFIERGKDPLVKTFIPQTLEDAATDAVFHHFPDAIGAVDATVIPICRPCCPDDQKKIYCGKHKIHCVKFQCLVNAEGQAIHISQVVEGKIHDKKLFDSSSLQRFVTEQMNVGGQNMVVRKPILCDRAYTGIQVVYPEAIIMKKKPPGAELTDDENRFNHHLSSDRMIVENYFGRLKVLFGVIKETFRCEIRLLESLIPMLVALTNYYLQKHPLRR